MEESRSYCAQDLRTSLDIVDVNRLPELSRKTSFLFRLIDVLFFFLSLRITIDTVGSSRSSRLSLSSCSFNFAQF